MKITDLPFLQVTLRSEGVDLSEFSEEQGGSRTHRQATNYVEAVPGTPFVVFVSHPQPVAKNAPNDRLSCSVYLDGKRVSSMWINTPTDGEIAWAERVEDGFYVRRRFEFGTLSTTDETHGLSKKEMKEKYQHLGEVTVSFVWKRLEGPLIQPKEQGIQDDPAVTSASLVPEKALKGRSLSNVAKLGEAEMTGHKPRNGPGRAQTYPYGRTPFAKFTFQYRSREDLHNEHIIPRSPSPVPLEERDPETLTLEEARELVRRAKERSDTEKRVKRERVESALTAASDSDQDGIHIVKTDNRHTKRQRSLRNDSGTEIIDLCGE